MKFRSVAKSTLQSQIPVDLHKKIGLLAVREGRPDNEVLTRLLCNALGVDPSRYGITTEKQVASA